MMQWDRLTLGRMAKELGFPRDTLEKVCRLADVLKFMESDELFQKGAIILTGYSGIVMSLGTWQSIQWHYGSAETRKKIRSLWRKVTQGECNTNRKTE